MNRSLLLWVIAVGWSAPGMADDIYLSCGGHLVESPDQPARVRIASEESVVKLRIFVDPSASPTLHYATWQASGTLGMPIENGEICIPAAVGGSIEREISIPVPYPGAEKPLQFRVIVEAITHQNSEPRRLATLDILRRDRAELPATIAEIKESGLLLEVDDQNIRKTLGRHQIAYGTPRSHQGDDTLLTITNTTATAISQETPLIIDDKTPLYDSKASADIALLQKIQTRIQQMQTRKNTP